ncbi:hypothetical protein [Sulfuricurvum kujiense]|uniref:hypothetical protein n=1 Tax=Sulfuricurvum kujiense TaxID=148813 RepID=UPI00124577B4|nr:hypothetical protein [Sulfuricurvum kujiense]
MNNLKTVLTNSKSSYWLGHTDWEMMAADAITFGSAEIEAELARLSPEQIVDGLRVMFFGGADIGELQYLSERFEIDLDTVIGRYDMPVVIERTLAGNPQLCMDLGVVCDEQ